ncbi:hypothetical protein ISN45_At01g003350 [Arabidopsis thaliana x Arabidopsis arenosa]|uniref:Uncharacterized protein n=1 Tax=Arabidopsis thaliana x Arabidopsis arenosa TaxID=1240361 RepID=A0A8T2G8N7_9BRAS|nr:hypothetical protein ISN45_At01g003350 [Arabidopsis thaliana x Arabidopsis arenosa]
MALFPFFVPLRINGHIRNLKPGADAFSPLQEGAPPLQRGSYWWKRIWLCGRASQ